VVVEEEFSPRRDCSSESLEACANVEEGSRGGFFNKVGILYSD
jgi:hypothetical protein